MATTSVVAVDASCPLCGSPILSFGRGGRVLAEDLYWALTQKILRLVRESNEVPEELEGLERQLADTYFQRVWGPLRPAVAPKLPAEGRS